MLLLLETGSKKKQNKKNERKQKKEKTDTGKTKSGVGSWGGVVVVPL